MLLQSVFIPIHHVSVRPCRVRGKIMQSNLIPYTADKDAGARGMGEKCFHLPQPDSSMTLEWEIYSLLGLLINPTLILPLEMAVWAQE